MEAEAGSHEDAAGGFAHGQLQRFDDGKCNGCHGQAGPGAGDNNDCQNRCNGDAEYNTGN